jgi:hypothetical protein
MAEEEIQIVYQSLDEAANALVTICDGLESSAVRKQCTSVIKDSTGSAAEGLIKIADSLEGQRKAFVKVIKKTRELLRKASPAFSSAEKKAIADIQAIGKEDN